MVEHWVESLAEKTAERWVENWAGLLGNSPAATRAATTGCLWAGMLVSSKAARLGLQLAPQKAVPLVFWKAVLRADCSDGWRAAKWAANWAE